MSNKKSSQNNMYDKKLWGMIIVSLLIFLPNVFFIKTPYIEASIGYALVSTMISITINMKALYPESISFWMGRSYRVKNTDKKFWYKKALITTLICIPISIISTIITFVIHL